MRINPIFLPWEAFTRFSARDVQPNPPKRPHARFFAVIWPVFMNGSPKKASPPTVLKTPVFETPENHFSGFIKINGLRVLK